MDRADGRRTCMRACVRANRVGAGAHAHRQRGRLAERLTCRRRMRAIPAWSRGRLQSRRRCGRGEPSPGADVAGAHRLSHPRATTDGRQPRLGHICARTAAGWTGARMEHARATVAHQRIPRRHDQAVGEYPEYPNRSAAECPHCSAANAGLMENMPLRRRDSAPVPYHRGGWAHPRPHLRRDWAHPLKRLHWDWARPSIISTGTGLTPSNVYTGTGLAPQSSAPGLGSPHATSAPGRTGLTPRPHLHRDLACRQSCGFAWQDVEQCKAQYAAQDGEASRSGHGEASRCGRPLPSACSGRLAPVGLLRSATAVGHLRSACSGRRAPVGRCRRPPPVGLLRSATAVGHLRSACSGWPAAATSSASPSSRRRLGPPLPHLHRACGPHPCNICAGTGPTPPTSAPGPSSHLPHLHRDRARLAHICTGT
jgi:hypothetical protein